jgi:hypothetical protein
VIPGALDPTTLASVGLIFAGYSVIASLKDYKDWEADLRAGVQTFYTLAKRRGWNFQKLHRTLTAIACLCLLAPFPLLAWAGKLQIGWMAGGLVPVAVIAWSMRRAPSEANFNNVLLAIDGFLAYLTIVILL